LCISVADHDYFDRVARDVDRFYLLIFRLPVLKYGNFSFWPGYMCSGLSIPDNKQQQYSPIEHLVIDGMCDIHDFSTIFSYVPRLRHFSCGNLWPRESTPKEVLIVPPYLTHLSIEGCFLSFDEFELFISKIGSQLKVLLIAPSDGSDYLDAN
jgi:hypothetical protein